jgi:hypothetical protein
MPQQSLFGGWPITDLEVHVHLNADKPGGAISAVVKDSNGQRCEAMTVRWQKDRDVSDLGMVLKAIAEAFLWGEHGSVSSVVSLAPRAWLPEVPLTA